MAHPRRIELEHNVEAVVEDYEVDRESLYEARDRQNVRNPKFVPSVEARLRHRYILMPEIVYRASGINIIGKRIKSLIFTTDVAVIRNNNANAILAVYPFTPELTIMQSVLSVASQPVFVGIGGGMTTGKRSILLGLQADLLGASGVVVNAPIKAEDIKEITDIVDIPLVATVISPRDDYMGKIKAGAKILNVSGGKRTPELVKRIRKDVGESFPIIATGGHTEEHILATIQAGANAISYTPPTSPEIFRLVMEEYRARQQEPSESK